MNVSVAVVTYNSSTTIIETLESILNQNYGSENIELVISDDASKDNCTEIIEEWLKLNSTKFSKVIFIKNLKNGGISNNINKAWKSCSCEWIKSIAGDDILETECIKKNVDYVKNNSDCKIVFSKMKWFGSVDKITPNKYNLELFDKNAKKQYAQLKYFSFNFAPTSFIHKESLKEVGYSNEKYRNIEDLPLWLKFTAAGYKLHFFDYVTVRYRVADSISMSTTKHINYDFLNDLIALNKEGASSFFKSPIDEIVRQEQLILYKSNIIIGKLFKNKKNKFTRFIRYTPWIFMPIHTSRYLKIILKSKTEK